MDSQAPRDTETEDVRQAGQHIFTGRNMPELNSFLIASNLFMSRKDNGEQVLQFAQDTSIHYNRLLVQEKLEPREQAMFFELWSGLKDENDDQHLLLLLPDMRIGTTFREIALQARECLMKTPQDLVGAIKHVCGELPENIVTLDSLIDVEQSPVFRTMDVEQKGYFSMGNPWGMTALKRTDVLDSIMSRIETFAQESPEKGKAIGCDRGFPWTLRLFNFTRNSAKHFIHQLYSDDAEKPVNVHCDTQYYPPELNGYETNACVDDTIIIQDWNLEFQEDDLDRWREIISDHAAENASVWVFCVVCGNDHRDVAIKIFVAPHA